jgi:hypothetical protein
MVQQQIGKLIDTRIVHGNIDEGLQEPDSHNVALGSEPGRRGDQARQFMVQALALINNGNVLFVR